MSDLFEPSETEARGARQASYDALLGGAPAPAPFNLLDAGAAALQGLFEDAPVRMALGLGAATETGVQALRREAQRPDGMFPDLLSDGQAAEVRDAGVHLFDQAEQWARQQNAANQETLDWLNDRNAQRHWATQMLYGLTSFGGRIGVGATLGGAGGAAGLLAETEAVPRYTEARREGLSHDEAMGSAAIEGAAAGALAFIPPALEARQSTIWARLGYRAATGAGLSALTGAAARGAQAGYLRALGHEDAARRYAVLGGQALLADAVMGAAFGGLFGHGRPDQPAPGEAGAHPETGLSAPLSAAEHLDRAVEAYHGGDLTTARAHALLADHLGEPEGAFLAEQWGQEGGQEIVDDSEAQALLMGLRDGAIEPDQDARDAALTLAADAAARADGPIPLNIEAEAERANDELTLRAQAAAGEELALPARQPDAEYAPARPAAEEANHIGEALAQALEREGLPYLAGEADTLRGEIRRLGGALSEEESGDLGVGAEPPRPSAPPSPEHMRDLLRRAARFFDREDAAHRYSDAVGDLADALAAMGPAADTWLARAIEDEQDPRRLAALKEASRQRAEPGGDLLFSRSVAPEAEADYLVNKRSAEENQNLLETEADFFAKLPTDPEQWRDIIGAHPWINSPSRAQLVIMASARRADGGFAYSRATIAERTGYTYESVGQLVHQARDAGVPMLVRNYGGPADRPIGGASLNRAIEAMEAIVRAGGSVSLRDLAERLGAPYRSLVTQLSQLRRGKAGTPGLRARLAALEAGDVLKSTPGEYGHEWRDAEEMASAFDAFGDKWGEFSVAFSSFLRESGRNDIPAVISEPIGAIDRRMAELLKPRWSERLQALHGEWRAVLTEVRALFEGLDADADAKTLARFAASDLDHLWGAPNDSLGLRSEIDTYMEMRDSLRVIGEDLAAVKGEAAKPLTERVKALLAQLPDENAPDAEIVRPLNIEEVMPALAAIRRNMDELWDEWQSRLGPEVDGAAESALRAVDARFADAMTAFDGGPGGETGVRAYSRPRNVRFSHSRGDRGFASAQAMQAHAEQTFGAPWPELSARLKLKIATSPAALRAALSAEGYSYADQIGDGDAAVHIRSRQTSYLIASNVTPLALKSLVLHEVGWHHGAFEMLGRETLSAIGRRVEDMAKAGHPLAMEAVAMARRAGADAKLEEAGAYLAERAQRAIDLGDAGALDTLSPEERDAALAFLLHKRADLPLVSRILAAVRQWLVKTFGARFARHLTADDVREIALAGLRKVGEDARRAERETTPILTRAPMFSRGKPAPVFYSMLERAAAGLRIAKGEPSHGDTATGAQWLATLSKIPGVKKEELDWTGLPDWLKANEGQITREAVLSFVRANGVVVKEVVLGGEGGVDSELQARLLPLIEERERIQRSLDWAGHRQSDAERNGQRPQFTDEEVQQIRDGRARIHELSAEINPLQQQAADQQRAGSARWSQYQLPGGENYRELLLRLPAGAHTAFRSSHFSEPNILAHVRFNERVDASGKRTLFIEELQSDWHQGGRERGYGENQGRLKEVTEELARLDQESQRMAGDRMSDNRMREESAWHENRRQAEALRAEFSQLKRAVPDAPFKNNAWAALGLKRMIRWAAENGYEQIAWTRGQHQIQRFGLSHVLGEVTAYKLDDGRVRFEIENGRRAARQALQQLGEPSGGDTVMTREQALEAFGADAGARLFDEATSLGRKFAGEHLNVGGEGMRAFYDRIMPNIANDLGKKYGARVGETVIETTGGGAETVHALPIPQQMADAAVHGMPLFSRTGAGDNVLASRTGAGGGADAPHSFAHLNRMSPEALADWYAAHVEERRTKDGGVALHIRSDESLARANGRIELRRKGEGYEALLLFRGRTALRRRAPTRSDLSKALHLFSRSAAALAHWLRQTQPEAVAFTGDTPSHERLYRALLARLPIAGYEARELVMRSAVVRDPAPHQLARSGAIDRFSTFVLLRDDIAAKHPDGAGPIDVILATAGGGRLKNQTESLTLRRGAEHAGERGLSEPGSGPGGYEPGGAGDGQRRDRGDALGPGAAGGETRQANQAGGEGESAGGDVRASRTSSEQQHYDRLDPVEQALSDDPGLTLRTEDGHERPARELIEMSQEAQRRAAEMKKGFDAAVRCAIRHGGAMGASFIGVGAGAQAGADAALGRGLGLAASIPAGLAAANAVRDQTQGGREARAALHYQRAREAGNRAGEAAGLDAPTGYGEAGRGVPFSAAVDLTGPAPDATPAPEPIGAAPGLQPSGAKVPPAPAGFKPSEKAGEASDLFVKLGDS